MYKCGNCGNECTPIMSNVGISASCCEEAAVLVAFCPSQPDKCQGCETRPLTDEEERELLEEFHADLSPAERARARVMSGPR